MTFCLFLILLLLPPPPSHGQPLTGAALIKEVCTHTSDFTFCSHTLSSDPLAGTPQALAGELAVAALRLAQAKAADSTTIIGKLLRQTSSAAERRVLKACRDYNSLAVSQLSAANNEINSESIDLAVEEVSSAAKAIRRCKYQARGGGSSTLAKLKSRLLKLCEICVVSTKYVGPQDSY